MSRIDLTPEQFVQALAGQAITLHERLPHDPPDGVNVSPSFVAVPPNECLVSPDTPRPGCVLVLVSWRVYKALGGVCTA